MRARTILLLGLLFFPLAAAQHDPEDYLLEKEDSLYRELDGFDVRVNMLLHALERRITVLECRQLDPGGASLAKLAQKDELLAALDEYTDDRLLRDYAKGFRSLMLKVDGVYAYDRSPALLELLRSIRKKGEKFQGTLERLEPALRREQKNLPWLNQSLELTRKAVAGAGKGLKAAGF